MNVKKIITVLLVFLLFNPGCKAKELVFDTEKVPEYKSEPLLLNAAYTIKYLPGYPNSEFLTAEALELSGDTVLLFTGEFDAEGQRYLYSTYTYDRLGNVLSHETAVSEDRGRPISGGRFLSGEYDSAAEACTFFLKDENGAVLAASPAVPGDAYPYSFCMCGDYPCAYNAERLLIFDETLSLCASVDDPDGSALPALAEVRLVGEDTFFLRYESGAYPEGIQDTFTQRYLLYDLSSDTETPLEPALVPTFSASHRRGVFYGWNDGKAVPCYTASDGVYRQENGEDILLLDFADSSLSDSRLELVGVLPAVKDEKETFLAFYTDPMTELRQPVLLLPAPGNTVTAEPVRIASVGIARTGGQLLISDAALTFNQIQSSYRAFYHAYSTGEDGVSLSDFEKDLLGGEVFDVYFFGMDANGVNALSLYNSLAQKNVFLDLTVLSSACGVLPNVAQAFSENGTIPSLPIAAVYDFLCGTADTLPEGEPFDLAALKRITESLSENESFLYYDDLDRLSEIGYCAFYDKEDKTCSFGGTEFRTFLSCVDELRKNHIARTQMMEAGIPFLLEERLISDGTLKFYTLRTDGIASLSLAQYHFRNQTVRYCGYPVSDAVSLKTPFCCAVYREAASPEGAEQFVSYLYSDRVQTGTSLLAAGLPVTESALRAVFPIGNNFYEKDYLYPEMLRYTGHHAAGASERTANLRSDAEYEITAEMREQFLAFLTQAPMVRACDPTVLSIIREELSACQNGIRSEEEACAMVEKRVFLYINE